MLYRQTSTFAYVMNDTTAQLNDNNYYQTKFRIIYESMNPYWKIKNGIAELNLLQNQIDFENYDN